MVYIRCYIYIYTDYIYYMYYMYYFIIIIIIITTYRVPISPD